MASILLKGTKLVGQVKVTYKLSDGIKDTTYHIDCCDSNVKPIFNLIKVKYEEYNQTNIGDIFDVEYLAVSKKRLKFKRVVSSTSFQPN